MKINGIEYQDDMTLQELTNELKKKGEFEEFAKRTKRGKVEDELDAQQLLESLK